MNIEAYFKITYGLYIVGTRLGDKLNGYVSNTVFQVTADPARFAIACHKNNHTASMIMDSHIFSIAVLKQDTRADIIGTFGYRSGRDTDKFAQFNYKSGDLGAPVLLDDTLAWFECRVEQTLDTGSHLLFVGAVADGDLLDPAGEPLTYAYYREVKKGKAPKNAPTYVDPEKLKQQIKEPAPTIYYCTACGYEYDPARGDADHGFPPGTKFEDLPDDWVCPVCGTEKALFAPRN